MEEIVVLNFGGQYAHLIANRLRRLGAYSTLRNLDTPLEDLKSENIKGIILSGGGDSVNDLDSPTYDPNLLSLNIPILGICYGFQWIAKTLGGVVEKTQSGEYGKTKCYLTTSNLFEELPESEIECWMSHWDSVTFLPENFQIIASTDQTPIAAYQYNNIYGLQFHPEVTHTRYGSDILSNFINLCGPKRWSIDNYYQTIENEIKINTTDNKKVFILVSGGVDSSVTFALLNQILGPERIYGVLVDTGLMRKDEPQKVEAMFKKLGYQLHISNSKNIFMERLKNAFDPEEKRRIIGDTFIDVKDMVAKELNLESGEFLLAQGTIYPDTIESGCADKSKKIKTHHNRVDRITELIKKGHVIEPLKDLYKDEVRELGRYIGLPDYLIDRHPFPGPGLGVRILCCNYQVDFKGFERDIADTIINNTRDFNFKGIRTIRILPLRSVGVQGDERTYKSALVFFLNDLEILSDKKFNDLARSIPNQFCDINRVLVCINNPDRDIINSFHASVTENRVQLLQDIDEEIDKIMLEGDLHSRIWQFPVVLIPVGDKNKESVVLRPVESTEAMTADPYRLDVPTLEKVNSRLSKYPIEFIFYDITSKPPGTIEWE